MDLSRTPDRIGIGIEVSKSLDTELAASRKIFQGYRLVVETAPADPDANNGKHIFSQELSLHVADGIVRSGLVLDEEAKGIVEKVAEVLRDRIFTIPRDGFGVSFEMAIVTL